MPNNDEVRLVVPSTPEFLRLARVTATGLASRLGFTYDEVEDLRLAIDELCFALIGSKGRRGTLRLCYSVAPQQLHVEGTGEFDDEIADPSLTDWSQQIMGALVDEYGVGRDDAGKPCFWLRKRQEA